MGADLTEQPQPVGWDELLTRLAARPHARVDGDTLTISVTRRARATVLGTAILALAAAWFIFTMAPSAGSSRAEGVFAGTGAAVIGVLLARAGLRRGPALRVDARGLTAHGVLVPWGDIVHVAVRARGKWAHLTVAVRPDSSAVSELPAISRWVRRRRAARAVVRGVEFPVADSGLHPVRPDELPALLDHPAAGRRRRQAHAMRPVWAEEVAKLAGARGVDAGADWLRVSDADGAERLRIDSDGITGLMPDRLHTVAWEHLDHLALLHDARHAAVLLLLAPGAPTPRLRGRAWAGLAEAFGQPVAPVPVRPLPFDAYGLTVLLSAHPRGEDLWRRSSARP